MITFDPIKPTWIRVKFYGTIIGEILQSSNTNTFDFFPRSNQGFSADELCLIHAELVRLNALCPS